MKNLLLFFDIVRNLTFKPTIGKDYFLLKSLFYGFSPRRFFYSISFVLVLLLNFQYVEAQTPSYSATLTCIPSTLTSEARTKATTTYANLTPRPYAGTQGPATVITESWTVTTDAFGFVGMFHGLQINASTSPTGNVLNCINQTSNSRLYALYAYTGNTCTGPPIAPTTTSDGVAAGGAETNPMNPAWSGLTPNATYVVIVRTTVGGSCLDLLNTYSGFYGLTPATFTFNCGTATNTGTFVANNTGGQTGNLTIPITGATAGPAIFNVSGTGFTGTLNTTLTAGQTSVVIPITYNGTGGAGTHTLTVTSSQGTGTCTKNVTVYNPTNSDGDGVINDLDLDDDNDGILDTVECPPTQIQYFHNDLSGQTDAATFNTATASTYFSSTQNTTFGSGLDETTDNYANTYLIRNATATTFNTAKTGNDYVQVSFVPAQNIVIDKIGLGFFTNSNSVPDFNCGNFKIALEYSNNSAFTSPTLLFQDKQIGNMIAGGYLSFDFPIPSQLLSGGTNYFFRFYLYDEQNTDPSNRVRFDDLFIPFTVPTVCDLDGDGIANTLDLDSDGDGCSDAIEGGANFATTVLVASTMPGGNSGTGYTGSSTNPVTENLGNTVGSTPTTTLGVPTIAGTGQTVNNSQNKLVRSANCPPICVAGTTAPIITATTVMNTCPATTFSLAALANTGTKPTGTTLIWSTRKVPASAGDTLTNLTTVSTAGKYYAMYYDKVANCYSPADSVTATITVCLTINQPATQTGTVNTSKSGTVSADVTPTGGLGTITYTNGSTDPLCVQPMGATALPMASNLTISSTGAYSYTVPSAVGTYYFCVKVCDSTTPTPDCKIATYQVTATAVPCNAGTVAPTLTATTRSNVCPATTADLSLLVSSICPVGSALEWHNTNTGLSAATKVANPASVGVGTYYPVCFDATNTCYSPTPTTGVTVTITACCQSGAVAPIIVATTITNTCPTTTFSLAGLSNTGIKPAGTTLIWSTRKVPASAGDTLTNLTTVSTAGKYYAMYYDKVANCYSPADSVTATLTVCTVNPPAQSATNSQAKSGNAATELIPTGGNGTYVYSVDNSVACTPVVGATALPTASNLTVTNASTGAYSYTAPAISGTYYYCIKVCDTSTPMPNCTTKTYTLTVTCPVGTAVPTLK